MISVCIATYNGERFIRPQLESILSQLASDDEVIISDDNSDDKTIKIIEDFNDQRIKIFSNDKEKGYSRNFENAISKSKGDIVFLSDQDDLWHIDKVSVIKNYLEEFDFVVSDCVIIDSDNKIIFDSFYSFRNPYQTLMGNLFKFGYLGCCMAFRREVLSKALPFPANYKLSTFDNWIFLVSIAFYKVKISEEKLVFYRRHGNNTSDGGFKSSTSFYFKIKYRIYLLVNLIYRNFLFNK